MDSDPVIDWSVLQFVTAKRNVALAPNKLRAIEAEARRLAPLVNASDLPLPDAFDMLVDTAVAHGLYGTERERETVEHVIREGLAGRATGVGYAAPGRDQSAVDLAETFMFLGDAPAVAPRELIRKLLPAFGVAVTGGQSSAGKTFIEIHKALCLATGAPFFGRKIVERVGTVFVAAEGHALIPNRFAAARAKGVIPANQPIVWPKQIPDFSSPEGIRLFVRQLKALDKRFQGDWGVRLGQIVVDTVAACFAMRDEDDNAEATKVCNIMRSIGDDVGSLVSPCHHYGKNAEHGLRGASAWRASADLVLGVQADIDVAGRVSNRELVCAKARDGQQGPISPFDLEFVELGRDPYHEPYGSMCVVPADGGRRFDATMARGKGNRAILAAIAELMDGQAKEIVPRAGMPPVKAVKVIDLRVEFDRRYVTDEVATDKASDAKRMAFRRALDGLDTAEFAAGSAEGADWVWQVNR